MKVQRLSSFLLKLIISKYTIAIALFLVFLIFFDNHNLIKKYRMSQEIKKLETELVHYRSQIEINKEEITKLKSDSVYLEKVAREKYLMKKENEDIFLFDEASP